MIEKIENSKPSFYAIIPANVRYDKNLTANAKLLYGEITALCNAKGFCWSSNDYFAELYDVSKTSISKWISSLIEEKHIESRMIYKEGSKEILHRYLTLVTYPIEEKLKTPIEEKLKDNTTLFNNTVNNTNTMSYVDFICLINKILNRKFKGCTKSKRQFQARINEGVTLEDFQKAITSASKTQFHVESNFIHLSPEFMTRADKLDKFLNTFQSTVSIQSTQISDKITIPVAKRLLL